ncbi:MAG: precorrin-6y C5,15-methyltransferase subunit CbiE [Dehalococcoides mccartyi]
MQIPDKNLFIMGISGDGSNIPPDYAALIQQADLLIGSLRLLNYFSRFSGQKYPSNRPAEIAARLKNFPLDKKAVVLASGDPGFFGIGKYLAEQLGGDNIFILPSISSLQSSFARLGINWEDAAFISAHGRELAAIPLEQFRTEKLAVLTDNQNTPPAIAEYLIAKGAEDCPVFICQNMDLPGETICRTSLYQLKGHEFAPLNVMIILDLKLPPSPQAFGYEDSAFQARMPDKGLITKQEIRAISLAKMDIRPEDTIWDIGCGSGAMAIESARLAFRGQVYGIECQSQRIEDINANIRSFGVTNVRVIHGTAPQALENLPRPDTVFIGGSGGQMKEIISHVCRVLKPGGRIVINLTTLENLAEAGNLLKEQHYETETCLVNIARSKSLSGLTRLSPLNPIFILKSGRKT